jgi:DNA replication and repair protein RecF
MGDLMALLTRAYEASLPAERRRRVTMFGPHLDDVNFIQNGVDAKNFASRGQTRALVFAFKMAQMMAIKEIRGHAPIIILDDIVSELDCAIKANLIETVARLKTQVFFATTDLATFGESLPIDRVFFVREGRIA